MTKRESFWYSGEGIIVTEVQFRTEFDDMQKHDNIRFTRMNSPFYEGEKWAVRQLSRCLNKEGEWEWEPIPSSRDDAFYTRCRFDSLDEALEKAEETLR